MYGPIVVNCTTGSDNCYYCLFHKTKTYVSHKDIYIYNRDERLVARVPF